MPNKKSPVNPRHLLSIYNLFKGENSNLRDLRTLTICILAYRGFLRFSEVSVLKRDDIDIQDAYMNCSWSKVRPIYIQIRPLDLHQQTKFCFMPGQNYSEIHTKGKHFERKKRISVPRRSKEKQWLPSSRVQQAHYLYQSQEGRPLCIEETRAIQ